MGRDKTPWASAVPTGVIIHLLFDALILLLDNYPTETPDKA